MQWVVRPRVIARQQSQSAVLYFIIFFVVDFSLGRTPPDPCRAEERWLDKCWRYAGTWQSSWTGIWLSAKSPWTAAVHRSRWCLSEWCQWWFLQIRRTPDTTTLKTTATGVDIYNAMRMFSVENKVPFEKQEIRWLSRGTWWVVPFHRGRLQHNPL